MVKIILCVGIPASGKSTWTKEEVKRNSNIVRINRDDIRSMMHNYVWSPENEKSVVAVRDFIIKQSLKNKKDVIVDDCNISRRTFDDICKLASGSDTHCMVTEKSFYVDLDEAISRNAKREGVACVLEEVIRKMWKQSGGAQHKHYNPRMLILNVNKCSTHSDYVEPIIQDETKQKAAVFDNDGTVSIVGNRSVYDASNCDLVDLPNLHVIECMKLYFNSGYKIIFVSGREEKDRAPTERFYKTYFPEVEYELYMRPTGDKRKDVLIKEEIYNNHIKNTYYVAAWYDDRLQICEWLYNAGFPVFRVGNPCATF